MRAHHHVVIPTVAAFMTKIATTAVDITLTCSDGIQLAGQVWKSTPSNPTLQDDIATRTAAPNVHHRILCLHGWMDNCRSFHYFAPNLLRHLQTHPQSATTTTEIVALDLPGHGWSSHKSLESPQILLSEAVYYVAEAIQQLNWTTPTTPATDISESNITQHEQHSKQSSPTKFTLVGHSMGAAISCLYAAAFPEQIENLVLLEGGMLDFCIFNIPSCVLSS
jgi:pimeloyl-ACP methyl ester carboxylesterase